MFSDYKRLFWLIYISFMDRVVILWMHTSVCSEVAGACTSNGGIWLKSKVGEQGVLTWRGRDVGDDPFTDDCEATTPNSRDPVG